MRAAAPRLKLRHSLPFFTQSCARGEAMKADGKKDGAPLSTEEAIALIEAELRRATAERLVEDPEQFRRAHGPIDRRVIRSLVRRT